MKNYNLITEAEKALVSDSQAWSRLIVSEWENNRENVERRKQLVEFGKEYKANQNIAVIKLKAFSLNDLEYRKSVLIERFNNSPVIGKKALKVDGSFFEKFKTFFERQEIEEGKGTSKGHRIHIRYALQYGYINAFISGTYWENGDSISSDTDFRIYSLEDDKATIKGLEPFELNPFIDAEQEIKNAKEYLDYLKETEAKASELKSKCNYIMFDVIKNRI